MIRLGHIDYANCVPVHALLLDDEASASVRLEHGVPSALNAALEAGAIDVSPSSSIEYARHAERYRLFPGLAIGSRGSVRSILLETGRPWHTLDGADVALPTASATSVVLLRILLECRLGVRPRYRWFDQPGGEDPFEAGVDAALWIGDAALRRGAAADRPTVDLGGMWTEWTGLPFVYALWQTSAGPERDRELASLHALLLESRAFWSDHAESLSVRYAPRYGLSAETLLDYWRSLDYSLDGTMRAGLLRFYRLAAGLGEVPAVPDLHWIETAAPAGC